MFTVDEDFDFVSSLVMSASGYFFEGVGFFQNDGLPRFEPEVFPFEDLGVGFSICAYVVH